MSETDRASLPPAICLMGPTASGKSALAIGLARALPIEIISVDSALIYRGMEIGAARPSSEELAAVPHHLVNCRDPADPYSAADFRRDALQLITDIHQRGRLPVLAGGTMLYFKALRDGLSSLPAADQQLRKRLRQQAELEGWPAMHQHLQQLDPQTAARLHPNHSQRIERALEVYQLTGKPLSYWQRQGGEQPAPVDFCWLALLPARRQDLHQRIAQRFMQMLELGLVAEVEALKQRADLNLDTASMRAVGYRQLWQYLDGEFDYPQMCQRSIAATRQLAKRQLTWLRSWPDLCSLEVSADGQLVAPEDWLGYTPLQAVEEICQQFLRDRGN